MATQIMAEMIQKKRLIIMDGMHGFASIENVVFENKSDKTMLIVNAAYNINETFKNDLEKDAMASLFFKLLPVKHYHTGRLQDVHIQAQAFRGRICRSL